jgi:hypothetical protein
VNTALYNRWIAPYFSNVSDAGSVSIEDNAQWNLFQGGNPRWDTIITAAGVGNHYDIESFNSNEQVAKHNYGDLTGSWHFGSVNGGIKLNTGLSSVAAEDVPGLYTTMSGGTAPFDAYGNLIIKPRNASDASVEIWTGATPAMRAKFNRTQTEFSGNVNIPAGSTYQVNGVSIGPCILSTTTGIDAKIVATTNLYTVPVGKTAVITSAVIRVTVADTITVVPTVGIGIAAGETDIFASTALTGLDATTKVFRFDAIGTYVAGAAGNVIKLGIDTGATATTMTISVDLIGYLL